MNRLLKKVLTASAEELLGIIAGLGHAAHDIMTTPYGQLRINSRASYYRGLRELQTKGFVKKRRKANRNIFVLTEKGRRVLQKPKPMNKRNDGFSTVILFDIPEEKSKERTIFRRYLLRNGYTILQESVLIGPYGITNDIKELVRELKIRPFVTSFDAKVNYLI